jgi:two-component system, NarL family, sensor kinase
MHLLFMALSFFVQEKAVQQDTLLIGIQSKPDSVKAALYIAAGEKSFGKPATADSLGLLAFYTAKHADQANNQGRGAFIVCYANLQINITRSRQWADSAVRYFEKAKNYTWAGYVTRIMGVHYSLSNKTIESINYLQHSSNYFIQAKDSVMIAHNYTSLSLLYHNDLQDYTRGLTYALDALKLLNSLKNKNQQAVWVATNAAAINYDDSNQSEKALEYHFKNLKNVGDDKDNLATTNNNIGNTYRKKKMFAKAEPYFISALENHLTQRGEFKNEYDLATVYNNLSGVNWDLGRPEKAKMYRDSAIHYSILSGKTEKLMDTYYEAYRMSEKNKDFKDALVYLRHYVDVKDSSVNSERAKIVYDLEVQYESERKQQQIALLESEGKVKDLEIQRSRTFLLALIGGFIFLTGIVYLFYKRARDKQRLSHAKEREESQRLRFAAVLEAEENERSRVAKDLHDGIGQLLSTAKLTLSAIDEPPSSESSKMLNNSMQIIDEATREVRTISHNLMPATLTQIGLGAALHDLFMKINESNLLRINLSVTGLEERLPPSTEIAVYRVIQEIINNMIKHSKADSITVKIVRKESSMYLSIADNGVGFEKELIAKSTGLGWKNIFSRISMLNGEIEVDTEPGSGTNISIQFAV